jgi:hypothetical protein
VNQTCDCPTKDQIVFFGILEQHSSFLYKSFPGYSWEDSPFLAMFVIGLIDLLVASAILFVETGRVLTDNR